MVIIERGGDSSPHSHLVTDEVAAIHPKPNVVSEIGIRAEYRDACQEDASIDLDFNSKTVKYYVISSIWMKTFITYASASSSGDAIQGADAAAGYIISGSNTSADEPYEKKTNLSSHIHPGKIINEPLLSLAETSIENDKSTSTPVIETLKPLVSHGKDYAIVGPNAWRVLSEHFEYDYSISRPVVTLADGKTAVQIYPKGVPLGVVPRLVLLPLGGQWHITEDIRNNPQCDSNTSTSNSSGEKVPQLQPLNDLYPDMDEDNITSTSNNSTTIAATVSPSAYIPSTRQLALVSLDNNNSIDGNENDNIPARKKIRKMGRCGLGNLGNTCFMNSTLQCLAHTSPLRNYFLSEEYRKNLNQRNPLGTGGELAIEFAKLLQQMWGNNNNNSNNNYSSYSGNNYYRNDSLSSAVISPRDFKLMLGKHASQFIGYDQHDSQELATYLLDALHEDTNLITKKPYVEKTEQKDGEDDQVAAARAWDEYLQRDDSRIVNSFMGQVKSRVECPNTECRRISTTFDPFMYLSVPIPGTQDRTMELIFVPLNPDAKKRKLKVTLPKSSTISSLTSKISEQVDGVAKENIVIADVWNNEVYSVYKPNKDIALLRDNDEIYAYELAPEDSQRTAGDAPYFREEDKSDDTNNISYDKSMQVEVWFKKDRSFPGRLAASSNHSSSNSDMTFTSPLMMRIPSQLTVYGLRRLLAKRLHRVLNAEDFLESQKIDEQQEGPDDKGSNGLSEDDKENLSVPKEGDEEIENGSSYVCTTTSPQHEDTNLSEGAEMTLLKMIPLSYQPNVTHSSITQQQKRVLGSVRRSDEIQASPTDDSELELVSEMLGSKGRVLLYWPNKLVDYFDHSEWESLEVLPPSTQGSEDGDGFEEEKEKKLSVIECIDMYCKKEQLEETEMWYCGNCKTHVRAWKQFSLYSTAPILIIQLKRFHYSSASHRRDKIGNFIDFPLNGLDLRSTVTNWNENEEPVYDCYAVSNHYGNLGGGHYTAYAKNNGQWCYFDDSRVSEVNDENEVISNAAYVLYYRRRDLDDWDGCLPSPSSCSMSSSSSPTSYRSSYESDDMTGDMNIVSEEVVGDVVMNQNMSPSSCTSPLVDSVDGEELMYVESSDDNTDQSKANDNIGTFPGASFE